MLGNLAAFDAEEIEERSVLAGKSALTGDQYKIAFAQHFVDAVTAVRLNEGSSP